MSVLQYCSRHSIKVRVVARFFPPEAESAKKTCFLYLWGSPWVDQTGFCSLFRAGIKLQEMNKTHGAPGAFISDVLFLKE